MKKLRHFRCIWHHESESEAVEIWFEVGGDDYEVRRLEFFRDGRVGYAGIDNTASALSDTAISDQPILRVDIENSGPEFEFAALNEAEFEAAWNARLSQ